MDSYKRYRYFKGEPGNPFPDTERKTFWEWERMYFCGTEQIGDERRWDECVEDLLDRYHSGDLPDDPRIDRIMSYPPATLRVFCYVSAMKAKWFAYDNSDWELDY